MELEVLVSAEPTKVSPDPLFLAATEEITQKPVTLIREHGGSDARFICGYGIPVIMSRPYVGNLHAENEWIDIASMETLYRIYERYLEKKLRLERHHRGMIKSDRANGTSRFFHSAGWRFPVSS